jgi:thiol-disulfide isomerase/thioredoxin
MKQFLLYSFRLVLIVSLSLASVYEEGDTISVEHQNVIFDQCFGYDPDGEIKLADYIGKVLWIEMSATWCAPCWETIPEIDDLVLNWIQNPNVASFVSLADLDWSGLPTCEEWGVEGNEYVPIIVDGGSTQSGTDIISNWFISDVGGSPAYASYVFIDHTMTVRHKIANNDFSVELANQWIGEMLNNLDVKETQVNLPDIFYLHENYPNPFNASTTIEYDLKENGDIKLSVFDLSGREVDVIRENYQIIGTHTVAWETSDVPSGVYFFRLSSGKFVQTRKAVLLK